MFRTHKYSSRPEGPRADSTRTTASVTGRSSRLEYKRADSVRRAQVCTERRANSDYKEPTRSINQADLKMFEPTRTMHTDKITASFFSLLQIQIFKRLDFKSQRSESWKTIIKAVKAPLERNTRKKRKRKEEGVRRKGFLPYFHQIPKESEGEFKRTHHLLIQNQKASWRLRRRSSKAQGAEIQNLLQSVSSCNKLDN